MFSGIIRALEKPGKVLKTPKSMMFTFPVPKGWNIHEGDSISVDGICSTVTVIQNRTFSVFYMQETLLKTSLSKLSTSHPFNLEQSLTLHEFIGGHLVSGHVDTTAQVASIKTEGDSKVLTFSLPKQYIRYLIYKGSVAVNGVSLTIVSVTSSKFVVSLIPYTLSHTNLGLLKVKDTVNIEVDMLAKYLEKLLPQKDAV